MARRKKAAEAIQETPAEPVVSAQPEAAPEPEQRKWSNPFPRETVNLDGYKIRLQESRGGEQGWQAQIKFGEGGENDKPSAEVLDYLKSRKVTVTTKDGETRDIQQFRWNRQDAAWGMRIDFNEPAASRKTAEQVFEKVVEMVARERGVGRER